MTSITDAMRQLRENAVLRACLDAMIRVTDDDGIRRSHKSILKHLILRISREHNESLFDALEPHKIAQELGLAIQTVRNGLTLLRKGDYIATAEIDAGQQVYTVRTQVDPAVMRAELERYCAAAQGEARTAEADTHGRVRTHGRVSPHTHGRVSPIPTGGDVPTGGDAEIQQKQGRTHGRGNHYNSSYNGNGSSKTSTPSPRTKVGSGDLFEAAGGPCPGVELPTALQAAIDGGTAKVSAQTLIDAIRNAQRRGVDAVKIGMSLRKAVAMAAKDAGDREPSPSAMLTRGVWFVERSDGETISKPMEPRSTGAPKALNVNRDFHVPAPDRTLSIDSGPYEG
ncbi:hypothetical protein [uncultured Hyphomicrobium sp.]|uniref:hypothetical protein n=1 Tax=uncultured Hyphomicrobium sp. TaxID=194373 RepID=UPI0025E89087|nr:hypothetical protein [uncultured Hyphomicrobium sp.]